MSRGGPLLLRLAARDLRGGLSGFGIFLGCIALGVAAITGVGSVSHALSDGLAKQGRTILGGDVSFDLVQRGASPQELDFLLQRGRVSRVAVLRGMARRDDGASTLVEIKAVGADYPTAGAAVLDPPQPLADALAEARRHLWHRRRCRHRGAPWAPCRRPAAHRQRALYPARSPGAGAR